MHQNQVSGRVENALDYLKWCYFAAAILDVFHENEERCKEWKKRKKEERGKCPFKPKADIWCINESLRHHIHERCRCFWSVRSGYDPIRFPFSEDAVAALYFYVRKRQLDEINKFDREVDEAVVIASGLKNHGSQQSLFDNGKLEEEF